MAETARLVKHCLELLVMLLVLMAVAGLRR